MKFHPLYAGRFAMDLRGLSPRRAGAHRHPVDAQTACELLAGLANPCEGQPSQGRDRYVGHRRFNESFLLYASTSPFYPLFASLDVGAQMMKGRSGEVAGTTPSGLASNCARRSARSGVSSRKREESRAQMVLRPLCPRSGQPAGKRKRGRARLRGKTYPRTS